VSTLIEITSLGSWPAGPKSAAHHPEINGPAAPTVAPQTSQAVTGMALEVGG
jgi:hypothetical protein